MYIYIVCLVPKIKGWKWIEIKLTEMNMLMNSKYHITFVLDKKSMFTVVTNFFPSDSTKSKSKSKLGISRKHYVKPLELIWRKYPAYYNEFNTIHIDDLARNFAMNPTCGLKILPYVNAAKNKDSDKELLYLTEYLLVIAKEQDFKGLKHDKWKQYLEKKSQKI
ncbi:ubiquitin-like domain-containing CTD phosphatase 1 [Reticulomyxa filosa]|uniref:Ubiquitin-like domain-containing CTD phosphatase 1 n=1 Tax=Reticulomyxa filosa TaxID=46433 RepID=X6NXY6_RETFI|nr:ubiquitin-like domain-containing CTD phosphatase 1 [Reticulomyxa filosa]|eukprot:ETO30689.1 ubiquitin-like domain-containing CTD phosphatase 1 [Reticulomyxa filosa]